MAQVFFLLFFQTKLRDCHSLTVYLGLFLTIKLGSHRLRALPPTSSLLWAPRGLPPVDYISQNAL